MLDTFSEGIFSTVQTFKGGIRKQVTLEELDIIFNTPIWYRIIEGNICLDMFLFFNGKGKPFIISSQDALMENRNELPYFYRAKWRKHFQDFNFMTFNNPTLYFDRKLRAGYFVAPGSRCLLNKVIKKLSILLETHEKNMLFYGASAGGYFTLSNMPFFPASNYVVDIARTNFNKNINVENANLLKSLFNINEIYDVLSFWHKFNIKFTGKLIYLQNRKDEKFRRTQMSYFISQLGKYIEEDYVDFENIIFKFYDIDDSTRAHTPLPEDRVIPLLIELLHERK